MPIGVPVVTGSNRSELEDSLGFGESPSCACDPESILDQVATGAFDHSSRNRQALREETCVIDTNRVFTQVLQRVLESVAVGPPLSLRLVAVWRIVATTSSGWRVSSCLRIWATHPSAAFR